MLLLVVVDLRKLNKIERLYLRTRTRCLFVTCLEIAELDTNAYCLSFPNQPYFQYLLIRQRNRIASFFPRLTNLKDKKSFIPPILVLNRKLNDNDDEVISSSFASSSSFRIFNYMNYGQYISLYSPPICNDAHALIKRILC